MVVRSAKTIAMLIVVCWELQYFDQARAEVTYEVAAQAAQSVVAITARNCQGQPQSRTGTGFVFEQADQVVTANHVVAGCGDIELWYERVPGQPRRSANVSRILASTDLALLTVNDPLQQPALAMAESSHPDDSLKAIGYAVGQPTLSDLDLKISIGSSRLRDMLPTSNKREISGSTSIDLDAQILRFSRPLYPGMSGGPIFDSSGKVVAIVAGGLQHGAVAASWGWPASLLVSLKISNDSPLQENLVAQVLFARPIDEDLTEVRRCGALEFIRTSTLTYSEIARTSDNLQRLEATAVLSTRPRSELESFIFDIWTHQDSGATIVVPSGATLLENGDHCVANSAEGQFSQLVWGSLAVSTTDIQRVSLEFESRFMTPIAQPNLGWYTDQILTLPGPETRADGFVVNRKAFFIAKQMLGGNRAKAIHQFETIMARAGTFVGIAMLNENVEQCWNMAGQINLCSWDDNYLKEWARFVLATQMSTYPVY